jgi:DNA repair exonuclease SbcCD nuclease subunit
MSLLRNSILVSDLHLTSNPRDEYRWGLFPWLRNQIQKYNSSRLFVLGDLTDSKDYHSSLLVNRLVDELAVVPIEVIILRGNHDGIDPDVPYFRFLNALPNIKFVYVPMYDGGVLFLPHSRDPQTDWNTAYTKQAMKEADFVLLHATVKGSRSETGFELDGVAPELLKPVQGKIYSGDVHVPQRLSLPLAHFEYIGAPYPIRFGDKFKGRAIVYKDGKRLDDLHYPTLKRVSATLLDVNEIANLGLRAGDQTKVKIELPRSELMNWEQYRRHVTQWCEENQVDLFGLELTVVTEVTRKNETVAVPAKHRTPQQQLEDFCEREKMEQELVEFGKMLLEECEGGNHEKI